MPESKKMLIKIPGDIHKPLKSLAFATDVPLYDLVNQSIRAGYNKLFKERAENLSKKLVEKN